MVRVVADDDLVDQAPDDGQEFAGLLAAGDGLTEQADAAAVGFDDLGMEDDRRQGLMLGECGLGALQVGLPLIQGLADLRQVSAGGDRVDEVADLVLQLIDAMFDHEARGLEFAAQLGAAIVIALDDGADDVGREQLVLQALQYPFLEPLGRYPARIVAHPLLAMAGTTPAVLRDHGVVVAARALHQAGEDVALPALEAIRDTLGLSLASLRGRPGNVIDDAQIGRLPFHHLGPLIDAREALAALRVPHHADAAVADDADVDRVAEDTIIAGGRAVDGTGTPFAAARRRDAGFIEGLRDRARRFAGDIVGEDAADDGRLALVDAAVAIFDAAVRVDDRRDVVAVAAATGDAASGHLPLGAATDLVAQILDLERAHGADEADMQFGHAIVGEGEERDARKFQALEDMGGVAQVAGDAIERFGQDDVELAPIGGGEHGVEVGTFVVLAGNGGVGEGRDDLPALALSVAFAKPDLVLGRQGVLHVGAEARVYGDAAPFR